jgi:hypothetical protein
LRVNVQVWARPRRPHLFLLYYVGGGRGRAPHALHSISISILNYMAFERFSLHYIILHATWSAIYAPFLPL